MILLQSNSEVSQFSIFTESYVLADIVIDIISKMKQGKPRALSLCGLAAKIFLK